MFGARSLELELMIHGIMLNMVKTHVVLCISHSHPILQMEKQGLRNVQGFAEARTGGQP